MTFEELMEIIPGPDFPTGGAIIGRAGIRSAYATGRGSIVMRSKVAVEEIRKDREALIVTEIPYQVNKATLIEKIAELVRDKRVEGISDLRDESDRDGMRIVIEIKRDAVPDVVLNQLWRFTAMQSSFGANMIALTGGRPQMLTLKDMLALFVEFREEVVTRRTKHLLTRARDGAHLQVGLAIAVANIDEVIRLIRTSPDTGAARAALMARAWPARDMAPLVALIADPRHVLAEDGTIRLSEAQARAILELRLARLTALGRDEIAEALNKLAVEIAEYLDILGSRARVFGIIRDEIIAVKTAFATPRRTVILDSDADMEDEDLIQREDMVVLVSHGGYIKRVPLSTYRAQRRGGKGRSGMQTRDEDFVARLFVATTHQPVLYFSSKGQAYKEKVWRLPLAAPQARGKALVNLLPLETGERITTIMPLPEDEASWENLDVMFATTRGTVRRNKLSDFAQVNRAGKIAMRLDEGEEIVDVQICSAKDDVLLTTMQGQCIRFSVDEVRVFKGRDSMGVRGVTLAEGDAVISLAILREFDADGRGARGLSEDAPRDGGRDRRGAGRRRARRRGRAGAGDCAFDRALRRNVGRRADHPHRIRERLRQALLVLRIPAHRARRQGHRRDGGQSAQRQAGRLVSGRGQRRDHAGHRRRPAHPLPGRRHPRRRPRDPGRDRVRHRGEGAGGRRRAHLRAGRRGRGRSPVDAVADRVRPPRVESAPFSPEAEGADRPAQRAPAPCRRGRRPRPPATRRIRALFSQAEAADRPARSAPAPTTAARAPGKVRASSPAPMLASQRAAARGEIGAQQAQFGSQRGQFGLDLRHVALGRHVGANAAQQFEHEVLRFVGMTRIRSATTGTKKVGGELPAIAPRRIGARRRSLRLPRAGAAGTLRESGEGRGERR